MRKYLTLILLLIVLTPAIALAQPDFGTGYLGNTTLPTNDVRDTVVNFINVALGVLGIIVFVGIIFGGFMIMTAGGDSDRAGKGRQIVGNFVIGLIIIFLAFAITNFVFSVLVAAT